MRETVQLKYECRHCEQAAVEGGPQITTAEKPLTPIEKGLAARGLLGPQHQPGSPLLTRATTLTRP